MISYKRRGFFIDRRHELDRVADIKWLAAFGFILILGISSFFGIYAFVIPSMAYGIL